MDLIHFLLLALLVLLVVVLCAVASGVQDNSRGRTGIKPPQNELDSSKEKYRIKEEDGKYYPQFYSNSLTGWSGWKLTDGNGDLCAFTLSDAKAMLKNLIDEDEAWEKMLLEKEVSSKPKYHYL